MTSTEETIVYSNSRNGLGIRILGAKRATHKSGIYIREILEHGLAQSDGRLKVGDQILSINDESVVGVSREHAVNLLRSSAATNHVRFRVKHFHPSLASVEYQKLLYDEKSTDDDEDHLNHQRITAPNHDEQLRKSSRRHHRTRTAVEHNAYNVAYESSKRDHELNDSRVDLSPDAMQALLNSRFKLIDLVDLMKKLYPKLFGNDQRRELQFIEQLSQTNSDGRMTLKDFERQSSVLLGERINLLVPFFSSATNENDVRRELASCRATIDDLQTKISACEKSQRLSQEVELEYEDLLKFLYEQLHRHKSNEVNHFKQVRANDQLIHKLFNYLSIYVTEPKDEHILTQLKYEYEQQQKFVADSHSTFQERF